MFRVAFLSLCLFSILIPSLFAGEASDDAILLRSSSLKIERQNVISNMKKRRKINFRVSLAVPVLGWVSIPYCYKKKKHIKRDVQLIEQFYLKDLTTIINFFEEVHVAYKTEKPEEYHFSEQTEPFFVDLLQTEMRVLNLGRRQLIDIIEGHNRSYQPFYRRNISQFLKRSYTGDLKDEFAYTHQVMNELKRTLSKRAMQKIGF